MNDTTLTMQNFLYYPTRLRVEKDKEKHINICWYALDDSYLDFDELADDEKFIFATIREDRAKLVSTMTLHDGTVITSESTDNSRRIMTEKAEELFQEYAKTAFPEGLHWVKSGVKSKSGLYFGNVLTAEVQDWDEDGQLRIIVSNYHKTKFFADKISNPAAKEILAGRKFNASDLEGVKKDLVAMFDIERYESEKAARANAKAAELAAEASLLSLPALTGTPKQKAWGEQIRSYALKHCAESKVKPHLKRAKSAKWWIEHRDDFGYKSQR